MVTPTTAMATPIALESEPGHPIDVEFGFDRRRADGAQRQRIAFERSRNRHRYSLQRISARPENDCLTACARNGYQMALMPLRVIRATRHPFLTPPAKQSLPDRFNRDIDPAAWEMRMSLHCASLHYARPHIPAPLRRHLGIKFHTLDVGSTSARRSTTFNKLKFHDFRAASGQSLNL